MPEWKLPVLSRMTLPWKALLSLTVMVMGVGYLIALANLYLTYHLTDGEPGLTPSDLRRAFYGNRTNTKLASKIDGGSMSQYLKKAGDKEKVLSWIQDGADAAGYEKTVKPILAANCTRCHNPNGLQRFAPLTNYEEVMAVTQVDRGEPIHLWARVAHTHIQSIGLIFFVLGLIFCLTSLSDATKTAVIVAPFFLLVIDFGARFLARYWPGTIFIMMGAGAALGLCFAAMIVYPLYEMWLKKQDSAV